jgi:hypothetical protein
MLTKFTVIMLAVSSSLFLTKSLQLVSSKRLAKSLFRSRGGSVGARSNLCMVATSTKPVDITTDRLVNLRREMKEDGIDCIIIPTEDPHMSEYTAPYYYRREFISGFTGEVGRQFCYPIAYEMGCLIHSMIAALLDLFVLIDTSLFSNISYQFTLAT